MAVEKTHSTVDRTADAVQTSTERAARAAHEAAESLGEYGTRVKDQLRDTGDRLRETGRAAGERSREIMDQLTDYISEHPMTALGIAVAVGFVLGTVVGRSGSNAEEI